MRRLSGLQVGALDKVIRKVCPIHGISHTDGEVTIRFRDEATEIEREAAELCVKSFDRDKKIKTEKDKLYDRIDKLEKALEMK